MAKDTVTTVAEIALASGRFIVEGSEALTLPVDSFARNGVILLNERRKVNVIDPETGKAVEFTASVYLQRSPITTDESEAIAKLSSERDAKAEAKKAAEQAERERAVDRAFKLGQGVAVDMLTQIDKLQAAAATLKKL